MKAKTCFGTKELPDGGTKIKYFDIPWKEYELLVCRPRWLMIATLIFFFTFFSLGVFIVGWPEEAGGRIFSFVMVGSTGWACLWAFSQIPVPNRWRFLFAVGEKGVLLRIGLICRSYWFYPWSEISGVEKVTRGEIPEQRNDVITVYLKNAVVRYSYASFIDVEKKIKPLIEKYQLKKVMEKFPGEMRYGLLSEYDLSAFDAVLYKPVFWEIIAFVFCFFFAVICFYLTFHEERPNLVYFLVTVMFLCMCLIKLKAMLSSKRKRFALAVGNQGLLCPARKLLGKNETVLIPWRIIDHAVLLPNHRYLWWLDINFVLRETKNNGAPAEYLVHTYQGRENQQRLLHALSKYCTMKP